MAVATGFLHAASVYPERPDDARAVYVEIGDNVRGDGAADDTAGLQAAIDRVQETTGQGVVFIPSGRYRLSKTLCIWPGIRLIGYGAKRPVFVLGENAPGCQGAPNYMVFFAGNRPGTGWGHGFTFRQPTPEEQAETTQQMSRYAWARVRTNKSDKPQDASPGTFYSALSNIDFEIGAGNPGAVAIRGRYAQHCYLAHIDFHVGSGWAGIHDGGNFAEDLHFFGGEYGIVTRKPSPGWQYTLVDATFEGQRTAAIKEHEAGLTLIRPKFKDVPTAVSIDAGYSDEFWIKDARMEDISGPAIIISNENNFRTELNFEDVVCQRVPQFALFRESDKKLRAPGEQYLVSTFSHGLHFDDIGEQGTIRTIFEATPLAKPSALVESDIPALPPMKTWVSIQMLGAKGDGTSDDTEAFRKTIAAHRAIYLPFGAYRVTDTIELRPDTVLIGFHPSATRIFLVDGTPGFQGVGYPKPVIEAPPGGTNIMTGIGVYTNGINPRALAVKWMAGTNSLMNDVRLLGGHGTSKCDYAAQSGTGCAATGRDTDPAGGCLEKRKRFSASGDGGNAVSIRINGWLSVLASQQRIPDRHALLWRKDAERVTSVWRGAGDARKDVLYLRREPGAHLCGIRGSGWHYFRFEAVCGKRRRSRDFRL
jgi:hypothetical protein